MKYSEIQTTKNFLRRITIKTRKFRVTDSFVISVTHFYDIHSKNAAINDIFYT